MIRLVYEDDQLSIPPWVVDLESFRRWTEEVKFPTCSRIDGHPDFTLDVR
jgi:hypothetical protein